MCREMLVRPQTRNKPIQKTKPNKNKSGESMKEFNLKPRSRGGRCCQTGSFPPPRLARFDHGDSTDSHLTCRPPPAGSNISSAQAKIVSRRLAPGLEPLGASWGYCSPFGSMMTSSVSA